MARRICLALAILVSLAGSIAARAQQPAPMLLPCPSSDACKVANGSYRIALPPQAAAGQRQGAIVFFHGYQGSAAEVLADPALIAVARRLGVALIAPEGLGHSWSFPGSPSQRRDEFAYVAAMLDDVTQRFPIDPGRLMASGFSQGGSMVWYLACRMPTRFAAFAPIAGAFWEPMPASCTAPRPKLVHVHGVGDTTVPLAGRALRQGFRQGDLFKSFAILAPGGCTAAWADTPQALTAGAALTCRLASGCSGDARLELCLHSGGHVADAAWVERAWRLTMPPAPTRRAVGATLTSP